MPASRIQPVRRGSVLILVIALLAVLFVTGMGFLGMTSIDRQASDASTRNTAIALEADSIVEQLRGELSRDLWGDDGKMLSGNGPNEGWDYPWSSGGSGDPNSFGTKDDPWLAAILPETIGGQYVWRHISNVSGQAEFGRGRGDTNIAASNCQADTDMDGINDAQWILSSSGNYRYAVRIVDLSAMLNLNTGGKACADDRGGTPYNIGLTDSNVQGWGHYYFGDGDCRMLFIGGGQTGTVGYFWGRGMNFSPSAYNSNPTGRLSDNPELDFSFELDNPFIRAHYPKANPFRLTELLANSSYGIKPGPVSSRSYDSWVSTFDVARSQMPDILQNVDDPRTHAWSYRMYYTPYSWTRNLRNNGVPDTLPPPPGDFNGDGNLNHLDWLWLIDQFDPTGMGKVYVNYGNTDAAVHSQLYTRALTAAIVMSGVIGNGLTQRDVEQLVVNLVDWRDSDHVPSYAAAGGGGGAVDTVWNTPNVYGVEPQVFINELGAYLNKTNPATNCFAVELTNPYNATIDLSGWQIVTAGGTVTLPAGTSLAGDKVLVIRNTAFKPRTNPMFPALPWASMAQVTNSALQFGIGAAAQGVTLKRPAANGDMVVVDRAELSNIQKAFPPMPGWMSTEVSGSQGVSRGDLQWMSSRDDYFTGTYIDSLGKANWRDNDPLKTWTNSYRDGRCAPIAVPPSPRVHEFETLGQLHYLMLIGPEIGDTGEPVTAKITRENTANGVADLFLNLQNVTRGDNRVLTNLVRLSRRFNNADDNGNGVADDLLEMRLPGLININTAPPHVLRSLNYYMIGSEYDFLGAKDISLAKRPTSMYDANLHIYNYRERTGGYSGRAGLPGFRYGPGEVLGAQKLTQTDHIFTECAYPRTFSGIYGSVGAYTDSARNLRAELDFFYTMPYDSTVSKWYHDQAAWKDLNEQLFVFDRISDLITTRSDTFLAYVLVQEIEPGSSAWDSDSVRVKRQRRVVVVLDRSKCLYPPGHSGYTAPEVVARNVATW